MSRLFEFYGRLTSSKDDRLAIAIPRAVLRWSVLFYKELHADRAFLRAGGMAYTTLIAVVPMLLLIFGFLGAFGVLEDNQKALVQFLEFTLLRGLPEVSDVLVPGLLHADLRALGLAGVIGFLVVSSRLYMMVERAYNDIFGVRIQRSVGQRLMNFYIIMSVAPLTAVLFVLEAENRLGRTVFGNSFILLVVYVGLFVALKLFPGTRVRWRAAFAGSTVSMVLVGLAVQVFPLYVRWFASDDPLRVIYGSLGLIPVFLLWMYLLWVFVLVGVEVAYVAQHFRSLAEAEFELREEQLRVHAPTVSLAVEVSIRVGRAFEAGRAPVSLDLLAQEARISIRETRIVVEVLEDAGFLLETDEGVTVTRPPRLIQVIDVVRGWRDFTSVRREGADPIGTAMTDAVEGALDGNLLEAGDRWLPE